MIFESKYDAYSYLSRGLDAEPFARICRDNELYFTCYLEAIIDSRGKVYFAQPSHQMMLKELSMREDIFFSEDDIPIIADVNSWMMERYNLVSVRYDYINIPRLFNKEQRHSLIVLLSNNLIAEYGRVHIEIEYSKCKFINEENMDALEKLIDSVPKYDTIKDLVMNYKITTDDTLY